jgi:hypothetical protein
MGSIEINLLSACSIQHSLMPMILSGCDSEETDS